MRCLVMSDQRWLALGDKIDPAWAPERASAVRAALTRRESRRDNQRRLVVRGAVSTGVVALGGVVALLAWRPTVVPVPAPLVAGSSAAPVETVTVTQLSPDTVLAPLPDRAGRGF